MRFQYEHITSFREMGEVYLVDDNVIYIAVHNPEFIAPLITRISEFQESPEYAGKYFTLEEYKNWYMGQTKAKEFTYAQDWCGWNVSSDMIDKFFKLFDDIKNNRFLNTAEMFLRDTLQWFVESYKLDKYYLIVTLGDSIQKALDGDGHLDGLFVHEFKHAAFFLDNKYRNLVIEESKKKRNAIKFNSIGYNDKDPMLMIDENNAYRGTVKANEYFQKKYLMQI